MFHFHARVIGAALSLFASACSYGLPAEFPDAAGLSAVQTRCGWFINPSPANAWFMDPEGDWLIGLQGGYQAHGDYPVGPAKFIRPLGSAWA
jgi:hypothetical protein